MNNLIGTKNGTPVVSHLKIAEHTGNDTESVSRLIRSRLDILEFFGVVGFEIRKVKIGRPTKEYLLNEDQATFLMTLLKNTDEVVEFKFNLVKSFKLLKEVVNKPKTLEEQVKETVLLLDNRIQELETTIKIQAPKVEFAEAVGNTNQGVLIRDYCKILNDRGIKIGQNNLYKWLRENKYLMRDNRPYQAYAQYFSVKERLVKSLNGERLCLTTYLLGKGQEYFYKKLKLTLA